MTKLQYNILSIYSIRMVLMYGVTACCSCEVCQTPPPSDGYMMVVFIVGWSAGTVHIVEWCCMVLYGGRWERLDRYT